MEKITEKKSVRRAFKEYGAFCVVADQGIPVIKCFIKDIKCFEDREQVAALRELLEQYAFHIDMSTLEIIDTSIMALVNFQDYYMYDEQRFFFVTDLDELCAEIEPELQTINEHMSEIEALLEEQGVKLENGVVVPNEQIMPAADGGNGRIVEFTPSAFDEREYQ